METSRPTTEPQTVGPLDEPIECSIIFIEPLMAEILPYQETWPSEFQKIASLLRQTLGELAVRLDHIGSTAVPGLLTKDVIDIQITIATLDERVKSVILSLGYIQSEGSGAITHPHFVGPETDWEK